MRKISTTLVLLGLFAPWGAQALGIGDIRLHSALNQALNAEIPLATSDADELSDIRVTLASPEAFARAHIERSYLLTKLRFTTQKSSDGSYVIKVSSKDAIREPFLNFMIEVYWPQGRLQREFTVLLDPPDSFQEASASNGELSETESYGRLQDQPAQRPPPLEPAHDQPRRTIRKSKGSVVPKAKTSKIPVTETHYGPVGRNETLWSIAKKYQNPMISQRQMLVAIYKANPQAFHKSSKDAYALKAGATITIPDQASVARLADAAGIPHPTRNTVRLNGKAKTQAKVARLADAAGIPNPTRNTGRLNAKAKTQTKPVVTETSEKPDTQGQLQLLAPSESKTLTEAATTGKKGKTGKPRGDLALELVDTAKQENENYRKRLADLEQQLSAIQRLLILRGEQIASLQAQQKPAMKEGQEPASLAVVQPSAPLTTIDTQPPPSIEPAKTQSATVQPPVESPQAVPASPPASELQPTPPPTTKPVEVARPKPPPRMVGTPPVQQGPAKSTSPEKEDGVLAEIYYLVGGATGLLLLALLWRQFSRLRSAMIDNAESNLTLSDREKTLQPKTTVPEPLKVSPNVSEPSPVLKRPFKSEFTPGGYALSGEMEEVDPITEADVYLAYGRFKQAEDLILNAIEQHPERDDCWLKLLEIHYATESSEAFEKCTQELASTHKEIKPEIWEKIIEMGRKLCPGNPLFKDNKPSSADSIMVDTSAPSTAQGSVEKDIYLSNQEDGAESYDYPIAAPVVEKPNKGPVDDAQATVAYDFFSTEENGGKSSKNLGDDSKLPDIENIILYDKPETYPAEEEIEIPDESMEELLVKLACLSESESLHPSSGEKERKDEIQEDIVLGFGHIDESQKDDNHFEENGMVIQPLEDMDGLGTKLDLAKAHYDLGDAGAAREILQNVASLGNNAQKEQANSLLEKIDGKE